MAYSIQVLTDLPVLVSAWDSSFEFNRDVRAYSDEVKAILDARKEPLYYILDFHKWQDISLDNVMKAADLAARSGNSNFHHPMTKQVLFVTGSSLLEMVAKGMKAEIYGNLNIHVFNTVDEALNFVKTR